MYVGGKEIHFSDAEIVNIAGMGGMTRSDRIFFLKYTHRVSTSPTVIPHKVKVLPVPPPQAGASVPTTPVVTTIPAMTKVIPDKVAESETSKGKGLMNEEEQIEGHKKSILLRKPKNSSN